jgi:CHAT domain-containing protein
VGASNPGDPEVPRLPEARAEALAVAEFLSQPKVFVGGEALASSIEAAAPHAALIHFAGHTRFADGGTRLLLAQPTKSGPDWLDARAFRSHEFANCRLVVLSACSTGKREERAFDDIQDIAQTLTDEGVQQIVATHWDVDSAASVSLMKGFYSGLARGLTVPQALLQAESAMSATPEYRHPYFWAPYYVIGMGKSSLKKVLHDD